MIESKKKTTNKQRIKNVSLRFYDFYCSPTVLSWFWLLFFFALVVCIIGRRSLLAHTEKYYTAEWILLNSNPTEPHTNNNKKKMHFKLNHGQYDRGRSLLFCFRHLNATCLSIFTKNVLLTICLIYFHLACCVFPLLGAIFIIVTVCNTFFSFFFRSRLFVATYSNRFPKMCVCVCVWHTQENSLLRECPQNELIQFALNCFQIFTTIFYCCCCLLCLLLVVARASGMALRNCIHRKGTDSCWPVKRNISFSNIFCPFQLK